jgi:hypothetical protein
VIENFTVILLALMIFGPSIRFYDKQGKTRFMYDGIVVEVVIRILYLVESWRSKS